MGKSWFRAFGVLAGSAVALATPAAAQAAVTYSVGPISNLTNSSCSGSNAEVEQVHQVGSQLRCRVWGWQPSAPSVPTQVGNDHAVRCREMVDHRIEHGAADHQPVD